MGVIIGGGIGGAVGAIFSDKIKKWCAEKLAKKVCATFCRLRQERHGKAEFDLNDFKHWYNDFYNNKCKTRKRTELPVPIWDLPIGP